MQASNSGSELSFIIFRTRAKQVNRYHNEGILKKYQPKLQIGSLDSKAQPKKHEQAPPTPPKTPELKPELKKQAKQNEREVPRVLEPEAVPGAVAPQPGPAAKEHDDGQRQFGDMIPYADPSWYQSVRLPSPRSSSKLTYNQYRSPYFNDTHAALRKEVREWMESEIMPNVNDWEDAKEVPPAIYKAVGQKGWLAGLLGVKYPRHLVSNVVKSVPPEKWDNFHELVITDELARAGSGGFVWNILGGFGIGCPPVIKHGKKALVNRIIPDILNGNKRICLAITEPDAGSDVANLSCEAKLSADGKHYIVNGEKKWITNGVWSDYFTTAVRTGGPGMDGISVLLIERSFGGVSTRRMDCQGVYSSGTTYVTFEDVKVPVENLIGKENKGFRVIMTNFNHERIGIIIQATRFARVCYEESVKYANKRETFGKKLYEHPVIRMK